MTSTCWQMLNRMLFGALFGTLLVGASMLAGQSARAEELAGRVIDVPDSDTIVIQFGTQQKIVRLSGIDAPEMPQPFGGNARMALVKWSAGRQAIIEVTRAGRENRLEGRVLVDGRDLARDLVDQGLAWRLPLVDEAQASNYSRDLAAAERMARRRRAGLWRQSDPLPPWRWRRFEAEAQGIIEDQLDLPYDVNGRYEPGR